MKALKLTNLIPIKLFHFSVIGLLYVLVIPNAMAADAPGVLAQEPLQTSATAKPNIMFTLDNSASMYHIVIENTSADTCSVGGAIIPDGETIELVITGTGAFSKGQIKYGGATRDYGNTGSQYCFIPTGTYKALLRTNNVPWITAIPYTGSQLNWYFDTSTDTGADNWDTNTHKPGTSDRHTVARTSLKSLLDDLSNVRVGLSSFDGSNGALIDRDIADITSSHVTNMKSSIDSASQSTTTPTPLAESLADLGRYFSNNSAGSCGGGTTDLTIHPGEPLVADGGIKEDEACSTLLGNRISTAGPVEAWCQKNFVVILTDGQPTYDTVIADKFKDYDQDCTSAAATAGGYTCITQTEAAKYPNAVDTTQTSYLTTEAEFSDIKSTDLGPTTGFWDDVAKALYEIDLRPDLLDANSAAVVNNITTYTIGFADEDIKNYPIISETAANGGGSFLYAEDSSTLASVFKETLNTIIGQTSTSSAVTFNSSTLSSQSAVYQALFNTSSWSGELNSFPINGITGAIETGCTQGTNNCWKAAEELDDQTPSERFIIVNGDAGHAVEFNYVDGTDDYTNLVSTSDIPQALVDDLCAVAVGAVSGTSFPCLTSDTGTAKTANSAYLEDLVNYLRGNNTNEGSSSTRQFRTRLHDLGDIVNSSPVFVGEPQQNWPSTGDFPDLKSVSGSQVDISYLSWKESSIKDRPSVVYVASNDGMLHGFRAEDTASGSGEDVNISAGEEVFAFIPTGTFSTANSAGLHFIADKDYTHRFINDLSPTIADVYMDYRQDNGEPTWDITGGSQTFDLAVKAKDTITADWRTVILGSQGGGGKSLYLLDVTDPTEYTDDAKQNAAKLLLWEFTHNDLGYTFSKPSIAMMNNGKFAAIFGNGYNSTTCKAQLFVVFLEGGLDGTWTENTDYFIYDTGTAHGGGAGDCNGLSTPAVVDLNSDGVADRVYAGDLKGNMWVFDLCAEVNNGDGDCTATAADWGIADATPLMNANDGTNGQPITSKPAVSLDPISTANGLDDLIIVFGTGQYLTDADKSTTGTQRIYGVRDYDALNNSYAGTNNRWNHDGNASGGGGIGLWADTVLTNSGTARVFTSTENIGTFNSNAGWRMTLPDTGERMVVNPKIRNNIVFFNTLIPDDTTCSYGGSGWVMSVNLENGGIPPYAIFDLDNSGTIGDANDFIDGVVAAGEKLNEIPAESTFLGDNQYTPGSDGTINVRQVNVGDTRDEGRMSWKEIYEAQ